MSDTNKNTFFKSHGYTEKEYKLISKYEYGLGIEHEMQIFHLPKYNKSKINDFILFDSYSAVIRLLKCM